MQSKKHSIIESITSTAIGLGINVTAQHLIFPLFGIYIGWDKNFMIAIIFTFISIGRGYFIRRLFNHPRVVALLHTIDKWIKDMKQKLSIPLPSSPNVIV